MITERQVQLGRFRFEPAKRALTDEKGDIIPVRRQALEVLGALCDRAGEIVSKQELHDAVWGETAVTDGSLVHCIKEIRRALGDVDFELVQTFPRQGYRLVPSQGQVDAKDNRTRPVILVWPFDIVDENVEPRFNLTGALIGFLSQYPELSVVSRHTSMGLRGSELTLGEITEQTGATYVVTGYSHFRAGQQVIAVELLDALKDRNVWTGHFNIEDPEKTESLARIAERITTAVGYLTTSFAPPQVGAEMPNALAFHLEARTEVQKQTRASIDRAEELNRQSIDADPGAPFGYIGMGFVHYMRHEFGFRDNEPDPLGNADAFAKKAIEIAPGNSTALFLRGVVYTSMGRQDDAVACLERALHLTPNNASIRVAYSIALLYSGDAQEAVRQLDIVAARAAVFPTWHLRSRAMVLWAIGRSADALECLRRDPTLPPTSLPLRAVILVENDKIAEARTDIEVLRRANSSHSIAIERAIWEPKFHDRETTDRWLAALRTAGLPETA